jgi:hypothetical protein
MRVPHRAVFERVLVLGHVDDAMDEDARQVNVVGIDRAVVDERSHSTIVSFARSPSPG